MDRQTNHSVKDYINNVQIKGHPLSIGVFSRILKNYEPYFSTTRAGNSWSNFHCTGYYYIV